MFPGRQQRAQDPVPDGHAAARVRAAPPRPLPRQADHGRVGEPCKIQIFEFPPRIG